MRLLQRLFELLAMRFAAGRAVAVEPVEFASVAPGALHAINVARPAESPRGGRAPKWIISRIDTAIEFLILERNLIVRNIRVYSQHGALIPYHNLLRTFVVINAHIWLLWLLGRGDSGDMTSYVVFYTGGFTPWLIFSVVARAAIPTSVGASFTKNLNIKWIHLFIADAIWEGMTVFMAFMLIVPFYQLFPFPELGPPIVHIDFVMLFVSMMICVVMGAGYGVVLHTASTRWPALHAVTEVFRWFIFITSGLYISYATLPWYVARFVWWQPMVAPIAFCRFALDSAYPTSDLSLAYSAGFAGALLFAGLGFRRWERKTASR